MSCEQNNLDLSACMTESIYSNILNKKVRSFNLIIQMLHGFE